MRVSKIEGSKAGTGTVSALALSWHGHWHGGTWTRSTLAQRTNSKLRALNEELQVQAVYWQCTGCKFTAILAAINPELEILTSTTSSSSSSNGYIRVDDGEFDGDEWIARFPGLREKQRQLLKERDGGRRCPHFEDQELITVIRPAVENYLLRQFSSTQSVLLPPHMGRSSLSITANGVRTSLSSMVPLLPISQLPTTSLTVRTV
jgi:hypothetical protein